MKFSISDQMTSLLYSLLIGVMLGAVYDIMRSLRVVFSKKSSAVFACDLIFMLIFTFVSVFYSMSVTRGNTRYYIVIGELLGFFAVRLTLGRVSVMCFERIFIFVRKIIKIVIEKFVKTAKKLLQDKYCLLYNMNEKRKQRRKDARLKHNKYRKRNIETQKRFG